MDGVRGHAVANLKAGGPAANRCHRPGALVPQDDRQFDAKRVLADVVQVGRTDGRRAGPDQEFVLADCRWIDLDQADLVDRFKLQGFHCDVPQGSLMLVHKTDLGFSRRDCSRTFHSAGTIFGA
jgi:hypothetical protein